MSIFRRFRAILAARCLTSYRAGVTLVEMLIYAALFSVLIVVLSEILISMLEVRLETQANAAVDQDSRYLLSRFAYDIARSTATNTPASLGSSGSSLVLNIGGVNNTYQITSNNLTLTNASGTDVLNSPDTTVSGLTFRRLGNSGGDESVQILFTVTSVARKDSGPEVRSFQTTVGRR